MFVHLWQNICWEDYTDHQIVQETHLNSARVFHHYIGHAKDSSFAEFFLKIEWIEEFKGRVFSFYVQSILPLLQYSYAFCLVEGLFL